MTITAKPILFSVEGNPCSNLNRFQVSKVSTLQAATETSIAIRTPELTPENRSRFNFAKQSVRKDTHSLPSSQTGSEKQNQSTGWYAWLSMVCQKNLGLLFAISTGLRTTMSQATYHGEPTLKMKLTSVGMEQHLLAKNTGKQNSPKKPSVSFVRQCLLVFGTPAMRLKFLAFRHLQSTVSPEARSTGKKSADVTFKPHLINVDRFIEERVTA